MQKDEGRKEATDRKKHGAGTPGAVWGLLLLAFVIVPVGFYLATEAMSDGETYHPAFFVEKPDAAAVRSLVGPPGARDIDRREVRVPAIVKGIYVSAAGASHARVFPGLVDMVDQTELNAMVIDVKDGNGKLAFLPTSEELRAEAATPSLLGDLKEFTAPLREKGIYLIARIFVFQDPWYATSHPELAVQSVHGGLWRDYRGVPWLDPASKDVWKYNVAVAVEAFNGGFDEVQFDYIRFPSDGRLSTMAFPVWDGSKAKADVMAEFFGYLDTELRVKGGIPTSVDLFGLTMWQHDYDLNIGQRLDRAVTHFDFISPMVYPSHYPPGFDGFANPAEHPYDIVYKNLVKGQRVFDEAAAESARMAEENPAAEVPRIATARPWIQDFDLGAVYTPAMVRAQMKAAEDGGASGWLLWNARNVYSRAAFADESAAGTGDGE